MGHLLLEGGAEFGGRMSEPDLRALELAGGPDAPVRIIPAAAAPDRNHLRAGANGVRWFEGLGARDVATVPVIDRASADDESLAAQLRSARLIYLLGGFPRHLGETLTGSRAWQAACDAYREGAVIAGSSAGAMVLCSDYYDPYEQLLLKGLGMVPESCVLPHHDQYGKNWAASLTERLPDRVLIGIDESTGMLSDAAGAWTVYGAGTVTLYRRGQAGARSQGETFTL